MKGVGAGFVLVCLVGVVWCGGPEWSPCVSDGQSPRVVPKEVELSPPRVVAGKEVVLTVKGENIGGEILGGDFDADVYYTWSFFGHRSRKKVDTEDGDICHHTTCPLGKDVTFEYKRSMPSVLIPGKYVVNLIAKERGTGELILCMNINFSASIKTENSAVPVLTTK